MRRAAASIKLDNKLIGAQFRKNRAAADRSKVARRLFKRRVQKREAQREEPNPARARGKNVNGR